MDCILLNADYYLEEETDINVHRYTVRDDARMHTHDFIEIAYISGGRGTHRIDGKDYGVKKGDLVILNAFVPHQFQSEADDPLVIYNCVFLPPAIDQDKKESSNFVHVACDYLFHSFYDKDASRDFIWMHGIRHAEVEPILREMLEEREKRRDGYRQVLKSDLMRLLIFIFRLYKEDAGQAQNPSAYKELIVQNTLIYMRENCGKDIRLEELAGRAYVSQGYLSRIFKEVSGQTVIRALQEIRMDKACTLLEKTNYTVSEVAAQVGYADMKYFYTLFSQLFGVTPGEYRDRARGQRQG